MTTQVAPHTRSVVVRQIHQGVGAGDDGDAKPGDYVLDVMVRPLAYQNRPSKLISPAGFDQKWGLLPSFLKAAPTKNLNTINARSDSIAAGSGMWKLPRDKRRCIVPVSGYYEWLKKGTARLPYYTTFGSDQVMCLAGLWDEAT